MTFASVRAYSVIVMLLRVAKIALRCLALVLALRLEPNPKIAHHESVNYAVHF